MTKNISPNTISPNTIYNNDNDNDTSSGANITKNDQKRKNLEKELNLKKKQLKEDYHTMLKNVKQNPYLKVAIQEYETFFVIIKCNRDRHQKKYLIEKND